MVHVYVLLSPQSVSDEVLSQSIEQLPQWRREQALRFKHKQGRAECALSYHLLCRALSEVYGIVGQPDFAIAEHGKSSLVQYPHIHFSISHCKHAIAVAVSAQPVGIDIERVGRCTESVVAYAMNDAERQSILASPSPEVAFATLWTQKEAVAKLTGMGITDDIKSILSTNDATVVTHPFEAADCILSIAQKQPFQLCINCFR